jgi:hypothetical protein
MRLANWGPGWLREEAAHLRELASRINDAGGATRLRAQAANAETAADLLELLSGKKPR